MIKHMSKLAAFTQMFLSILFMSFLFSCKKDAKPTDTSPKTETISPYTTTGGGPNCYEFTPLVPQSDGTLKGWIENVPIQISNMIVQVYDNYGNPVTWQQGDPFYGQINILTSTPAEVIYNSSSPLDDQFILRVYQMGGTFVDMPKYLHDRDAFIASHPGTTSGLPSYLLNDSFPKLSSYISTGSVGTYHDVTGRLIRINPQEVETGTYDMYGNPIFVTTTYAWAQACYPRPGLRAGQTTATIATRNVFSTPPQSLTVYFIKDGMTYRTLTFPSTYLTTSSPTNIPAGTYTVRITKNDLNFQAFTLMGAGKYWEVQAGQNCTNGYDLGTVTINAGTNYTLTGSTEEQ